MMFLNKPSQAMPAKQKRKAAADAVSTGAKSGKQAHEKLPSIPAESAKLPHMKLLEEWMPLDSEFRRD